MHDDQDNKDDGSVWTSYSDLFTTVAVIFLVMFVFALIKAGVSQMQSVVAKRNHEKELKAEVTKEVKKETDKKVSLVEDSLQDISQYEDLIDQKMKDMNKFVSSLKENKKVLNELIKDQQRKEAQLAKASELIKDQEQKIEVEVKEKNELKDNLLKEKELVSKVKKENENLNLTIKEKESLVKNKINTITKLTKSQSELMAKYQNTVTKVENLQETKKKKTQNIKELTKNLSELTLKRSQEIEQFNLEIEKNEKVIKEFEQKVASNKQVIEQTTKTIQEKEQVIAKNEKLIENQAQDIAKKKELMNKQLSEMKRLHDLTLKQDKEIDNLQIDVTNKVAELAQTKQQLEKTQSISEDQKIKINALTHEVGVQEAKARENRIKLKNLQDQHIQLVAQTAKISEQKKNAEKQASELAQTNDLLNNNLKQIQQDREKLKVELSNLALAKNTLQNEVKSLKQIKTDLENENLKQIAQMGKLNNTISQMNKEAQYYQNELSKKALDINTLKASLDNLKNTNQNILKENNQLAVDNSNLHNQLRSVNLQNDSLRNQNQMASKANNELQNEINKLNQNLTTKNIQEQKLLADVNNLKLQLINRPIDTTKIGELEAKNKILNDQVAKLNKDLGFRQKEIQTMEQKFIQKFKDLDQKDNKLLSCKNESQDLKERNKNLKESLNDFASKVADVKGKLRSNIAKDLAKAFKDAKLSVLVDNKTGNVVLQMDENFRFKKNSYYLNKKAKATLKKIVPIYSKVLFGNKDIRNKISSFNVVGHASPSFRGQYVDPSDQNSKAYSYNMRLSAQRASSITNFIFSNSIGKYPYKSELQLFTKAIGQGYIKPVAKEIKVGRKIASQGTCGPFDCYSSQRVEISFTLKDDVNSINELIEMSKNIK